MRAKFKANSILRMGFIAITIISLLITAGCGGTTSSSGGTTAPTGGGTGTGGSGGGSTGGGSTSNITITISPKRATAVAAGTLPFVATVSGDTANAGAVWKVDGIAGGSATVGTITGDGMYTAPSAGGVHTVAAFSASDNTKTDSSTVAVTDLPGVFTYHNNLARDGTNTREFALNTTTVAAATFGKLSSCSVDGEVYPQPLWVPNVSLNGVKHNTVFAATAHDSVYAFDADASPCSQLWQASLLDSAHGATVGETSVPNADAGGTTDILPEIGIIGTPVIDASTNILYVVSQSEGPIGTFHHRLHALDLVTGNEKLGGPVNISGSVVGAGYDSSGATVSFNPGTELQRAGLALVNGVVYITWASHGDTDPYHGWIIGYNTSDLSQAGIYNITADGQRGGIWMSGGAPAADSANAIYLSTGNGTYDHDSTVTPNTDLGDSVMKLTTVSGVSLSDWFSPFNQSDLEDTDRDLGSGGVVLLPDQSSGPAHLLVTGGKEGKLYLINRDSMGHFCMSCSSGTGDTNVVQSFSATTRFFDTPAFWQGGLYVAGTSDKLIVFTLNPTNGTFGTSPSSQSSTTFQFPGSTPSISSQDSSNGIVWAIDSSSYGPPENSAGPAVLHAYDATNLASELWNSSQAPNNRDVAGPAVKFTVPTVANGKVYIGTKNTVEVYGLLPD
jgi:hypothetical protein